MAEEAVREQEERVIRDVIDARDRPAAIKGYEIEFGDDHSGDQAVWIWLLVKDEVQPSQELLEQVLPFSRKLGSDLLEKRLSHWPYVRFRTWVRMAN